MSNDTVLVKVSGASPAALRAYAARLADFAGGPGASAGLDGIAWAATTGRADLTERAAVVAATREELIAGLRAIAAGEAQIQGQAGPGGPPKVAFLAPGHGVRIAGALAGLYGRIPVITETIDALGGPDDPALRILTAAGADPDVALRRTDLAQPALYALAVALGTWWRSVGVEPELALGHSVGAYAAAALAGVFSVPDGARLIAGRGALMAALPATGMMASVRCEPELLSGLGAIRAGEVAIAVFNSPRNTVVSGPADAVAPLLAELDSRGIRSVRMPMPYAFHSAEMDAVLGPLGDLFGPVALHPPRTGFVSDLAGEIAGPEVATIGYWVRHTREPVRFGAALRAIEARPVRYLVELGPGDLLPLAAGNTPGLRPLPSVGRGEPGHRRLLETLAALWVNGAEIAWARAQPRPPRSPRLPTYPFQRETYWIAGVPAPLAPAAPAPGSPARESAPPRTAPAAVPAARRPAAAGAAELGALLLTEVASVLGLADDDGLEPDTGLFDLGLTSAMVADLRARLQERLGREVPVTAVFDHPTVASLAEFLAAAPSTAAARAPRRAAGDQEALAIVGMACRFPGGADDLDAFWRILSEGIDATSEVPAGRWDDPGGREPGGEPAVRRGGFLAGAVAEFDADAFGISPREARGMDPQQRLLLEVAYEALDDAGYPASDLEGTATGVYVGINTSDYMQLLAGGGQGGLDPYLATGNTFSAAAGRISYLLGLRGPSLAVDTACSSSLVAAHLAAQSLRSGETDVALVAGVNLMLAPATTASLAQMRALAADGRCKTFAAAADGYGRGEGCGVVVLRRLSDARAAGDRIWAVLRGTAVNQDGRSAGLTVPNGRAQQDVIRAALADAGLDAAAVTYVEAHGTGTPLGDPLEISSLVAALRPDGPVPGGPLLVGSAKTNVAHLEAAAGVCGLIKVALALHHREIPPSLHFGAPSPHVPWGELPVAVPTRRVPWELEPLAAAATRVAGLSSFGFSGTNAHAILEEAPAAAPAECPGEPAPGLLVLSAHTQQALAATAAAYRDWLPSTAEPWAAITATAARHRSQLRHRLAVTADSRAQAAGRLAVALDRDAALEPGPRPDDVPGVRAGSAARRSRLVFAYGGGPAAPGPEVARVLLDDPVAGALLSRCARVIRDLAGWSLEAALVGSGARLRDERYGRPAALAVQAALTELWRSWGVVPEAVVGRGAGQLAAALAAGLLGLEEALQLAAQPAGELPAPPAGELPSGNGAGRPPGLARARDAGGAAFPARSGGAALAAVVGEGTWRDAAGLAGLRDVLRAAAIADGHNAIVEVGPDAALAAAVTDALAGHGTGLTTVSSVRTGREPRAAMLVAAAALHVAGIRVLPPDTPGRRAQLPGRQWQRARHWLPPRPAGRTGGEDPGDALARDCYEIGWPDGAPLSAVPERAAGRWLLIADGHPVAGRIAGRLTAAGADCQVVAVAEALPDLSGLRGVVHLGALDAGLPDGPGRAAGLGSALERSCGPLPALAAALPAGAALWIVTSGAAAVGGAPVSVAQAPAWGLGRTIALEQPEIWGGLLDLDPDLRDPDEQAAVVVAELLGADGEDQIAYRASCRLVARLRRTPPPPAARPALDSEAAYLVTGGRGVLGLRIAAWLARRGARHIVLLGRTPLADPPAERDQPVHDALARLRSSGVSVYTPSADVADGPAMAGLLARAPWPGLRGVVHAAGVFEPAAVSGMDWARFRAVLRSKAEGSLVLDALTAGLSLDFFVMFSSASSVWGSALAGPYAAANYFEDVLAHDRARRGLPALAVNWGWWSGSEMAAHHEAYFEAMGLAALPDEAGFAALDRLIGSPVVQLTVAPVDWARFRPVMEAKRRRPLLELLGGPSRGRPAGRGALDRLRSAETGPARVRLAEDLVQAEVAAALGRDPAGRIERDLGFFEAGMDSITSMELKGRLEAQLGLELPATAAFEHPTVSSLAAYLLAEVLDLTPAPERPDPPSGQADDALNAELDQLNEDELLRLLHDQL